MQTSGRRQKMISYAKYGYIFIAPFFIVYAFFMIYPLINTIKLSFMGNTTQYTDFVGLQNYKDLLLGDPSSPYNPAQSNHEYFFRDFGTTLILWGGNFLLQIVLSLLLAVWFSDVRIKIPGTGFFKVIMYLPNIITASSVAAMFLMLFGDTEFGAVNSYLINLGAIDKANPIVFIDDVTKSRVIVMIIQSWMWFGNTMLLLMSGIFGIDPSIYEAAEIDGSSGANTFFRITMPILKPIFIYVLITSMIGGLQMFDIPYLFHPANQPKDHLETVAVFIYKNFTGGFPQDKMYGYSAAASVILFIITLALGLLINRFNSDNSAPVKKSKAKNK